MAENKARPWDRLANETQEQWEMFEVFIRERSNKRVAELCYPEDKAVMAGAHIVAVKKQNQWEKRVTAYDRWITEQRDNAVAAMVKAEFQTITKDRIKMLHQLRAIRDKAVGQIMPKEKDGKLTLQDAHLAVKIIQATSDEYDKFAKSNPAEAAKPENPYQEQVASATTRLEAFIATHQPEARPSAPVTLEKTEIRQ